MNPDNILNHYYYGMTFQHCTMPNATFQTINQVPASECPPSEAPASATQASDAPFSATQASNTPTPDASTIDAPSAPRLPDVLSTDEARDLLDRLTSAGLLTAHWQPLHLSAAEKGVLASLVAARLDIGHQWQTFGHLWGMKPETLRTAFNKGMEQRRTGEFMRRAVEAMEGR